MVLGHPSIAIFPPFCSFQEYRVHLSLLDGIVAQSCSFVYLGNMGSKLGRVFLALIISRISEDPKKPDMLKNMECLNMGILQNGGCVFL